MPTLTKSRPPKQLLRGKKPKTLVNHVALVIDTSGSMGHIAQKVTAAYHEIVDQMRKESLETGQQTKLTLITFCSDVTTVFSEVDIQNAPSWTCWPTTMTALFDGIGNGIREIRSNGNPKDDNAYLLIVITDGVENDSKRYTLPQIEKEIQALNADESWTLAYMGPKGSEGTALRMGFLRGDITLWDGSEVEFDRGMGQTQSGMSNYYVARSAGAKATKSAFYKIDLHDIDTAELRKTMSPVQHDFHKYLVTKEQPIEQFVEEKTKRPYMKGMSFYQLTKKETLQDHKELLVEDKVSRDIYGGRDARKLIGLPEYGSCKVEPLNLAQYNLYVQSTSTNRKLVRGTNVLVRR